MGDKDDIIVDKGMENGVAVGGKAKEKQNDSDFKIADGDKGTAFEKKRLFFQIA